MEAWITPTILVALILFVWRDLGGRIDRISTHLGSRIDRINDRLDRHLEGHP